MQEHPPDANHGFEVEAAMVYVTQRGRNSGNELNNSRATTLELTGRPLHPLLELLNEGKVCVGEGCGGHLACMMCSSAELKKRCKRDTIEQA